MGRRGEREGEEGGGKGNRKRREREGKGWATLPQIFSPRTVPEHGEHKLLR